MPGEGVNGDECLEWVLGEIMGTGGEVCFAEVTLIFSVDAALGRLLNLETRAG